MSTFAVNLEKENNTMSRRHDHRHTTDVSEMHMDKESVVAREAQGENKKIADKGRSDAGSHGYSAK